MGSGTDAGAAAKPFRLRIPIEPVASGGLTPALVELLGQGGLHCGSGASLHRGWINTDICSFQGSNGLVTRPGDLVRISGRYFYQHDLSQKLPLAEGTMPRVFAEHLLEHLPRAGGAEWLADVHRMLKPGGRVRLSTPDLALYANAYTDPEQRFFRGHVEALKGMGMKSPPTGRAWLMNQLFRFWGHEWIYDFEEVVGLAEAAGFPAAAVRRVAFRQGADMEMAALDRKDRRDESLYVEITKPAG